MWQNYSLCHPFCKAPGKSNEKATITPTARKKRMFTQLPIRTRWWWGRWTRRRTGSSTTRSSRPTRSRRRPRRQPSRPHPQSWRRHPCPPRNPKSLNFLLFLVRDLLFCDNNFLPQKMKLRTYFRLNLAIMLQNQSLLNIRIFWQWPNRVGGWGKALILMMVVIRSRWLLELSSSSLSWSSPPPPLPSSIKLRTEKWIFCVVREC